MRKTKGFTVREQKKIKELLQEKTGYRIRSNSLLEQIFTRSTYTAHNGGENNEVLEFIGDQVLSYYLVKALAKACGGWSYEGEYAFRFRENHLTAIKQELVCNETLCQIIDEWGIAEYVVAGRSDWPNGLDDQPKVRADLFEAILGAIALESQWNSEILEKAVQQMLSVDMRLTQIIKGICERESLFNLNNAVRILKELAEHGQCSMPEYEFAGPEILGYDKDGNPKWSCRCSIINANTGIMQQVWGSNKGDVKKTAAYLTLCAHFEVQNAYGPNQRCGSWYWQEGRLIPGSPEFNA